MENFKTLGLSSKTVKALEKKGFEEPTEIQACTIPLLLENQIDIIAQAQTGTGKTAAFGLPLIERLDPSSKKVQALVLAPTRELVIQVCEELNSLQVDAKRLSIAPIYGGQSIELQLRKLRRGISIVVGTPGRILDHINRGTLKLKDITYFILDEADEMLNMGFIEDIEEILSHTKEEKRVLLFSATMPARMRKLAEKYMGPYKHVKTKTSLTTSLTDQIYFEVQQRDKFEALCRIIDIEDTFYGLVFCRTKTDVDELSNRLIDRGYSADGLHGDMSQAQREKILNKFRKNKTSILVATDVAARGIDVVDLTHVINYAIPQNPEAYIHRIGRTGRAGKQGTAITFITSSECKKLGFIKRAAKADIRKESVPKASEIIRARKQKITADIEQILQKNKLDNYREMSLQLLGDNSPVDVLSAVIKYFSGTTLDEKSYRQIASLKNDTKKKNPVEEEGHTRLFIAKGKKHDFTKKTLLNYLVKKSGVSKNMIDGLEIYDNFSFINVPFIEAEIILRKFGSGRKGKRAVVVKAKPAR